ncbi:MAG: HK97 family phage prohead protease [Pseudotabrizicola sp.]|uniref:HK97 family phage prohead protease n=1 Tax=Pseudotabrizicola sp. TaxID=2939647 RepID=UPI0027266394|nr:HK97 family phage prohead protease [Pseudotabrizicola sp.]MDO9638120.1 HK97 family phage prohead protease [Pseudotabrizicola sp.]
MLWGAAYGALELRQENGGVRLSGRFPYSTETELAPGKAERIEARAFAERIEAGEDIHLLSGHDYEKPLASRAAGNLTVTDTDAALVIEATIDGGTSWARDFLAAHSAGLVRGLSPGFRVPTGGERIERRGAGLLRSIQRAELFEISAVTRPAYPQAQIEARCWNIGAGDHTNVFHPLKRWRL